MNNETPTLDTILDEQACANRLNVTRSHFRKLVRGGWIHSTVPVDPCQLPPEHPLFYFRDIAAYIRDVPSLDFSSGSSPSSLKGFVDVGDSS